MICCFFGHRGTPDSIRAKLEETIRQLHQQKPDFRIVVGGAVMTQDYADKIGADCYGRDAMTTVRYADELAEKGIL